MGDMEPAPIPWWPRAGQTPSEDSTLTDLVVAIAATMAATIGRFLIRVFRLGPRPMSELLCHQYEQDPDSGLWMMCHLRWGHDPTDHYDRAYDKFWSPLDMPTHEVHH